MTDLVLPGLRDLFLKRFMSKVEVTEGCWLWKSRLRYDGKHKECRVCHREREAARRKAVR